MSEPLGHPWLHLRVTDSTNERARELALAAAPHGTLVTADEQTAGRGRQGRTWSAPPGRALLMSLVLRDAPALLPMIAGVAVCDAIEAVRGPDQRPLLKWPNDVVVGEERRKVAGMLVEGRPDEGWAVLGIGVNAAIDVAELPGELRDSATTLGLPASRIGALRDAILAALASRLAGEHGAALDAWRDRDALAGAHVGWTDSTAEGGAGVAHGIDDHGHLRVVTEAGEELALGSGEVHLLRL